MRCSRDEREWRKGSSRFGMGARATGGVGANLATKVGGANTVSR